MSAHYRWRWVRLGEVVEFKYGSSLPASERVGGVYSVYGSNGKVGTHNEALTRGPTLIIGRKGSIGAVHFSPQPCWPIDTTYFVDETKLPCDLQWLFWAMQTLNLQELNKAAAVPGLNRNDAYRLLLPLPPLDEQRTIARRLERDMAEVTRLRAQVQRQRDAIEALPSAYLRDVFEGVEAEGWPRVRLGEVLLDIQAGKSLKCEERPAKLDEWGVLKVSAVSWGKFKPDQNKVVPKDYTPPAEYEVQPGDLLISRANTTELVGAVVLVEDTRPNSC